MIDLLRERRTRELLAELHALDVEPERLNRHLEESGDPMPPKKKPAPTDLADALSFRLTYETIERAEALMPAIPTNDKRIAAIVGAETMSRGAVLRLAIVEGLEVLEAKYAQRKA